MARTVSEAAELLTAVADRATRGTRDSRGSRGYVHWDFFSYSGNAFLEHDWIYNDRIFNLVSCLRLNLRVGMLVI